MICSTRFLTPGTIDNFRPNDSSFKELPLNQFPWFLLTRGQEQVSSIATTKNPLQTQLKLPLKDKTNPWLRISFNRNVMVTGLKMHYIKKKKKKTGKGGRQQTHNPGESWWWYESKWWQRNWWQVGKHWTYFQVQKIIRSIQRANGFSNLSLSISTVSNQCTRNETKTKDKKQEGSLEHVALLKSHNRCWWQYVRQLWKTV